MRGQTEPRLLAAALLIALLLTAATAGHAAGQAAVQDTEITFSSRGTRLVGTLYLPSSAGPFPVIVGAHGSGRVDRSDAYLTEAARYFASKGVAFFVYDKRGVGASGGTYPGSYSSSMAVYAVDVLAALDAVTQRPDIRADQAGLWGMSQAGWIIPIAAAMEKERVAFTIIVSGPTVTIAEENYYSHLTGLTDGKPSGRTADEIDRAMETAERAGIDALSFIAELTMPGLWIYGDLDQSVPWRQGIRDLADVSAEWKRDFTWHVIEGANHGLRKSRTGGTWERPTPTEPAAGYLEIQADWLRDKVGLAIR